MHEAARRRCRELADHELFEECCNDHHGVTGAAYRDKVSTAPPA